MPSGERAAAICDFGAGPQRGRRGAELEDAAVEAVDTFFGDRLIAFLSRPRAASIAILPPDGYPSVGNGRARDLMHGLKTFAAGEPYRPELAAGVSGAQRRRTQGPAGGARRPGGGAAGHRRPRPRPVRGAQRPLPPAAGSKPGALADIARSSVAPLLEYDARRHTHMLDTLRSLLDNRFAIQSTAEAPYIHRNTLQKRMRRIETLLGVDLTESTT